MQLLYVVLYGCVCTYLQLFYFFTGECGVPLQYLNVSLRGHLAGTKAFIRQFVTYYAVVKFPVCFTYQLQRCMYVVFTSEFHLQESLISIFCKSLDTLSVDMVCSQYGQLLFALVEAFKNAPEVSIATCCTPHM